MREKDLKKELDNVVGNIGIEGHSISEEEKKAVFGTFQKYGGRLETDAIASLLYRLSKETEHKETEHKEPENGRKK